MAYESNWAHHRNAKTSRAEELSEKLGDGIVEAVSRARYAAHKARDRKVRSIRDAAEGMESAPGDRTRAPRKPLTRKEKREADEILKEGKKGRKS